MQEDKVIAVAADSIDVAALPSLPLTQWRRLPNCAAVYFAMEGKNVVYVGQTLSLVLRWQQHGQLKRFHRRTTPVSIAWFECDDEALRLELEAMLIEQFKPALNSPRSRKKSTTTGRFIRDSSEPYTISLSLRISETMYAQLKAVTTNDMAAYVRRAIALQLQTEENLYEKSETTEK